MFLKNAPDPRQFWARRQCHETTIHSVDAQSAALGRMPHAEDTEVTREVSLDGIDELLRGFHTRKRSGLRSDTPIRPRHPPDRRRPVLARARSATSRPSSTRTAAGTPTSCIEGPAEALYLALWNRTDEVTGEGYDFWRRTARVSWSRRSPAGWGSRLRP